MNKRSLFSFDNISLKVVMKKKVGVINNEMRDNILIGNNAFLNGDGLRISGL